MLTAESESGLTPSAALDRTGWSHIRDAIEKTLLLPDSGPVVVIADKTVVDRAPAVLGAKVVVWKEEWLGKPGLATLLPGLRHKAVFLSGQSLRSFYEGEVSSRLLPIRHTIFFGIDYMLAECLKNPQTRGNFPTARAPLDDWFSAMESLARWSSSRSVVKLVPQDAPSIASKHWQIYLSKLDTGAKDEDAMEKIRRLVKDDFQKWLRSITDTTGPSQLAVRRKDDPFALHKCCAEGNYQRLHGLLMEGGWDVTVMDDNNMTAAHVACRSGNVVCLEMLRRELARTNMTLYDLNRAERKASPLLHVAAEYGQAEVVRYLLNLNENTKARGNVVLDDQTLCKVVTNPHGAPDEAVEDIIGILAQLHLCRLTPTVLRAIVNGPMSPPQRMNLIRAIFRCAPDEIAALSVPIEAGCAEALVFVAPKCEAQEALFLAVDMCFSREQQECLVAILMNVTDEAARPVISRAFEALGRQSWENEEQCLSLWKCILDACHARCAPVPAFLDSIQALHVACSKLHPRLVKEVLAAGASATESTLANSSYSPMFHCLELPSRDKLPSEVVATDLVKEVAQLLLDAGWPINAPIGKAGITALMYAAQNNDVPLVEFFLSKGASLSSMDPKNKTVVHYAAMMGSEGALEVLLKAGAPVDVLTKSGLSAVEVSLENLAQARPIQAVEKKAAAAKPMPAKQKQVSKNPKKAAAAANEEKPQPKTEVEKLADALERPWANNIRQGVQWMRTLDLLLEYGCPIRSDRTVLVDRVLAKLEKSGADMSNCKRLKEWRSAHSNKNGLSHAKEDAISASHTNGNGNGIVGNGIAADIKAKSEESARDQKEIHDAPAKDVPSKGPAVLESKAAVNPIVNGNGTHIDLKQSPPEEFQVVRSKKKGRSRAMDSANGDL